MLLFVRLSFEPEKSMSVMKELDLYSNFFRSITGVHWLLSGELELKPLIFKESHFYFTFFEFGRTVSAVVECVDLILDFRLLCSHGRGGRVLVFNFLSTLLGLGLFPVNR